jgi:ATP-dependent Clp protease ATP-binding subunit ClpC
MALSEKMPKILQGCTAREDKSLNQRSANANEETTHQPMLEPAIKEKLNEPALKALVFAAEESVRVGHNFIGTEQILLGLIREEKGIAARVLSMWSFNLEDARVEVGKIIGRGSGFFSSQIPLTPRARRVLELGWNEARQLGHNYIGTEHLLLGLIGEGEGVAARVLENLSVDLTKIRSQVIRFLGEGGAASA